MRSTIAMGWRVACFAVSGALGFVAFSAFGSEDQQAQYVALLVAAGVGPLLVLPFTRKVVWLAVASVAGLATTAALMRAS
jgi:hypothetical protein